MAWVTTAFFLGFLGILCFVAPSTEVPSVVQLGSIYDLTQRNLEENVTYEVSDEVYALVTALQLGIDDVNAKKEILPETTLEMNFFDSESTVLGSIAALLDASKQTNLSLIAGPNSFEQCDIIAVASKTYEILLLSAAATETTLSSRQLFPLFSRAIPSDGNQTLAMVDLIKYYYSEVGEPKWLDVGIICTADDYGVGGSKEFIRVAGSQSGEFNITISVFQQFLVGETDVSAEIGALVSSESRVFIAFMFAKDFQVTILEAEKQGIVDNEYIWICSDGCATLEIFDELSKKNETAIRKYTRGMFGTSIQRGSGPVYEEFLSTWLSLDPEQYRGAGTEPSLLTLFAYDSAEIMARLYRIQFEQGNYYPNGTELFMGISGIDFEGVSGRVRMQKNGDRDMGFDVLNLHDGKWNRVFSWNNDTRLTLIEEPHFFDGTTRIPDLGVLSSFEYWSCHEKESFVDRTGKTIVRETPGESDPNNIDISYECDQFIDCDNLSDESPHCTPSLVVAFIVLGIITGLLVLFNLLFIPLSILFGWIIVRTRWILAGRLFLLLLSLGAFFGVISTFAWYGKPHTVACNFQLWLFGLATSLVVGAIFAKNLFKFRTQGIPIKRIRKIKIQPDLEFLGYFVLTLIVPFIIIIIWGAFATPEARVDEYNDKDHYMCTTGGLIGEPAGTVFFFVLVGYFGFLLFFAFIFLFLNRRAPNFFMENRLMFISIFNLGFVAAVVIPLVFVLNSASPFASWIVRTLGMIYAFTSTLWLHYIPKILGLVIRDKFRDNTGRVKGNAPEARNISQDMDASQSMSVS